MTDANTKRKAISLHFMAYIFKNKLRAKHVFESKNFSERDCIMKNGKQHETNMKTSQQKSKNNHVEVLCNPPVGLVAMRYQISSAMMQQRCNFHAT